MTVFGDLQPLCSHVPSYYLCNLFYRQARSCHFLNSTCILTSTLQLIDNGDRDVLTGLSQNQVSAPVGINPECGTLRVGQNGSLGNIANIVVCGLSFFFTLALLYLTNRRKAAVGTSFTARRGLWESAAQ